MELRVRREILGVNAIGDGPDFDSGRDEGTCENGLAFRGAKYGGDPAGDGLLKPMHLCQIQGGKNALGNSSLPQVLAPQKTFRLVLVQDNRDLARIVFGNSVRHEREVGKNHVERFMLQDPVDVFTKYWPAKLCRGIRQRI